MDTNQGRQQPPHEADRYCAEGKDKHARAASGTPLLAPADPVVTAIVLALRSIERERTELNKEIAA
jgi:hypothetical protein